MQHGTYDVMNLQPETPASYTRADDASLARDLKYSRVCFFWDDEYGRDVAMKMAATVGFIREVTVQ